MSVPDILKKVHELASADEVILISFNSIIILGY